MQQPEVSEHLFSSCTYEMLSLQKVLPIPKETLQKYIQTRKEADKTAS